MKTSFDLYSALALLCTGLCLPLLVTCMVKTEDLFKLLRLRTSLYMAPNSADIHVQGLFADCIYEGSGDPVRVLHLLHNEYAGYD